MNENYRLFLAVEIPPENLRQISPILASLKQTDAAVKWIEEKNLHITLKFIGETHCDRLSGVKIAAKTAASAFTPFSAKLSGTGAFPDMKKPKVLWIGIDKGYKQLKELSGRLDEILGEIGFQRDNKPFSPHLTLGRVRTSKGIERMLEILEANSSFTGNPFKVGHIVLINSRLTPGGPIYTTISRFALGG